MITTTEIKPGVIQVLIRTAAYGQAGEHWKQTLGGPNHKGYGRIFIMRFGADKRRYQNCYPLSSYFRGQKGANLDECPGAMFIWTGQKDASVEAIDAIDNQHLGRELGRALKKYPQPTEEDLWEVKFKFS